MPRYIDVQLAKGLCLVLALIALCSLDEKALSCLRVHLCLNPTEMVNQLSFSLLRIGVMLQSSNFKPWLSIFCASHTAEVMPIQDLQFHAAIQLSNAWGEDVLCKPHRQGHANSNISIAMLKSMLPRSW